MCIIHFSLTQNFTYFLHELCCCLDWVPPPKKINSFLFVPLRWRLLTTEQIFVPSSCRMSDTEDLLTSTGTQEPCDVSSSPPPSYCDGGQQPPPYSAVPPPYPPPKLPIICTNKPVTGYESFSDLRPEAPVDTTPLISSSSFDDQTVRRGFVRKVCATWPIISAKYGYIVA